MAGNTPDLWWSAALGDSSTGIPPLGSAQSLASIDTQIVTLSAHITPGAPSQCSWSPLTRTLHESPGTDESLSDRQECRIYRLLSVRNPKSTKRRRGRSTLTH